MKNKFPLVRIKQFISNPIYILFWLCRSLLYKRTSFKYVSKYLNVDQLTPKETLADIVNNNRSIIRFGDGEFGLLSGAGIFPPDSDWSQRYSLALKKTIERQLQLTDPRILIALPPMQHLRYQTGDHPSLDVIPSMHTEARMYLWRYLQVGHRYGDWSVFMPQHNKEIDWKLISSYLNGKTVVIVTGGTEKLKYVTIGVKTLFVECGKYDAYERKDDIIARLNELVQIHALKHESTLFWVSLGCTAGVIVEHLVSNGFVAWDTGHIFRFAATEIRKELV